MLAFASECLLLDSGELLPSAIGLWHFEARESESCLSDVGVFIDESAASESTVVDDLLTFAGLIRASVVKDFNVIFNVSNVWFTCVVVQLALTVLVFGAIVFAACAFGVFACDVLESVSVPDAARLYCSGSFSE